MTGPTPEQSADRLRALLAPSWYRVSCDQLDHALKLLAEAIAAPGPVSGLVNTLDNLTPADRLAALLGTRCWPSPDTYLASNGAVRGADRARLVLFADSTRNNRLSAATELLRQHSDTAEPLPHLEIAVLVDHGAPARTVAYATWRTHAHLALPGSPHAPALARPAPEPHLHQHTVPRSPVQGAP